MNFIRRIGRDEIYIKYVHQLVNVRTALLGCFYAGLTDTGPDAPTIPELRRSGVNTQTARGSLRMGFEFLLAAHGGSGIAAAVTVPSERDAVSADTRLPR